MALDDEYLSENFDPNTLTIPKLKSALTEVGVALPMKQERKQFYVELFQKHITKHRQKLARAQQNVQPSSEGIFAVSGRGSPREEETAALRRMYRDKDTTVAAVSPPVSPNFSAENPFQSGAEDSPAEQRRGRNKSATRTGKRRSVSGMRRRHRGAPQQTSSASSEEEEDLLLGDPTSPVPRRKKTPPKKPNKTGNVLPANKKEVEKFLRAPAPFPIAGYVDVQHVLEQNRKRMQRMQMSSWPSLRSVLAGCLALLLSLFVMHLYRWRSLPYCRDGIALEDVRPENEFLGVPFPLPQCRPCPMHGTCEGAELVHCANGYILHTPIFPFHPTCVPDRALFQNVETLRKEMSQLLSEHAGAVECGNVVGDKELKAEEIQARLRIRHVSDWVKGGQFDRYWALLMKDLHPEKSSSEIRSRQRVRGDQVETFFYSSKPTYDLSCRITKYILDFLQANRFYVICTGVILLSLAVLYYKIASIRIRVCGINLRDSAWIEKRKHRKRTLELVDGVIRVLLEQEQLFRSGKEERAAVSVNHIRDFFLAEIRSARERAGIWRDVRKEILHHSSVRETVVMIEGEQNDAWQWVGSSSLLSPDRRGSRPTSVSPHRAYSPYERNPVSPTPQAPAMKQSPPRGTSSDVQYPSL